MSATKAMSPSTSVRGGLRQGFPVGCECGRIVPPDGREQTFGGLPSGRRKQEWRYDYSSRSALNGREGRMPFFFREPNIHELRKKGKVRSLIRAMKYTTKKPDKHRKPWMIRSWAVEALAEIGDKRAVKPLLSVLSDGSEHRSVRKEAATALAGFQASEAIPHLIQALSVADVRESAAEALRTLGWEPGSDEAGARYWAGLV